MTTAMRIEVQGGDPISAQARTYAEYRLLAALTQSRAERVRLARLVLRQTERTSCASVVCSVTVAFIGSRTLRIRTTGGHAYAAVNRAIERLRVVAATGAMEVRLS